MAERASMAVFVPRTVASFERAATQLARRVAAPVRTVAWRAMSLAERVLGTWTGAAPTVRGFGFERPSLRVAERGGGLLLPRPWYEAAADADEPPTSDATTELPATRPVAAAERGAAIARPTLTAAPPGAKTSDGAEAERASQRRAAGTAGDRAVARAEERQTTATNPSTEVGPAAPLMAAADDLRVAEALGLRAPPVAAASVTAPSSAALPASARATTPLARALAHTAWVDAQLRTQKPASQPVARAASAYVFVASAPGGDADREAAGVGAAGGRDATSAVPPLLTVPVMVQTVAWSAALPDPRLSTALPTRIAQGVSDFIARLVGVQTARDAAALSIADDPNGATVAAQPARAPARALLTSSPEAGAAAHRAPFEHVAGGPIVGVSAAMATSREPVGAEPSTASLASAAVSWRPGAAAARSEQLGSIVDARIGAAWGSPPAARTPAQSTDTPVASLARTPVHAAKGPARLSQFTDALVGVQAMRATAPLPLRPTAVPSLRATGVDPRDATTKTSHAVSPALQHRALAPGGIALRAEQMGGTVGTRAASLAIDFVDPARLALLTAGAPAMAPVTAEAATNAATHFGERDTIMPAARPMFVPLPAASPGSRGLSAEEWSLVATFPSAATAVQMVAARQAAEWGARERAAGGAMRPFVAVAPDSARSFARPASALPTGAARLEPRAGGPLRRSDEGFVAAMKADAPRAAGATHGAIPMQLVVPLVAEVPSASLAQARLPDGRAPRGSFTWPKLADVASAREWIAPAAVTAAEYAKQAAPGTPLWGAMPSLAVASAVSSAATGEAGPPRPATEMPARIGAERATVATTPATATRAIDSAAMTLMTAAATREVRAAARSGGATPIDPAGGERPAVNGGVGPTAPNAAVDGGERARRASTNVRPAPAMSLMRPSTPAASGPSARALELARPFLSLIEGGVGVESTRSATPRFYEQPQPLVSSVPASDSASRIVEALRNQPATTTHDDRVSLADLTLIAMASATQQVAASPHGGGPGGGAAMTAAAPAQANAGHGGGANKSGNLAQDIEELARAAFDELQRLMVIARERSGDHG